MKRHKVQKQPPRGVLRKSYSENMQQIYRRTTMPKCGCFATLLKSHFCMVVLLYICCIFSEHLFLGTPLGGCFWKLYHVYWNFIMIMILVLVYGSNNLKNISSAKFQRGKSFLSFKNFTYRDRVVIIWPFKMCSQCYQIFFIFDTASFSSESKIWFLHLSNMGLFRYIK